MFEFQTPELLAVALVVVIAVVALLWIVPGLLRQIFCKHAKYREEPAEHALCTRCSKNLGAITRLREARPQDEVQN